MSKAVQQHFDQVAKSYTHEREKGLLSLLVAKEKKVFLEFLPIVKNLLVLDAGCGSGMYTTLLKERGAQVIAVDLAYSMARKTKSIESKTLVGSLDSIAFKKQFDIIIAWGSLEFVSQQEQALTHIFNLLKPSGVFLVLYPRKNIFGFFYALYHKILHTLSLTVYDAPHIEQILLNTGYLLERKKHCNVLTTAYRCRKYAKSTE